MIVRITSNCINLACLDVPIVVSLPHFLYANESVIESVDGMHPREDVHATFVSVEPVRLCCLIFLRIVKASTVDYRLCQEQ